MLISPGRPVGMRIRKKLKKGEEPRRERELDEAEQ
jgi:hypothetical protein